MSHRYEFARAAGEKNRVLVFAEGMFESLPFEVRLAAPWTGSGLGMVADLKPVDRRQLLDLGYAILRETAEITPVKVREAQPQPVVAKDEALLEAA